MVEWEKGNRLVDFRVENGIKVKLETYKRKGEKVKEAEEISELKFVRQDPNEFDLTCGKVLYSSITVYVCFPLIL